MSQKTSRKSAVNEEKEKSSDTPVKEMKKKMAANAEKEKQAAEKVTEKPVEKPEKTDKNTEKNDKSAEKTEKPDKNAEKVDKAVEKSEKSDKKTEKADKKQDKPAEKKVDPPAEKKEEKDSSKDDKSGKPEKPDAKKAEPKPKQNGKSSMNGTNGTEENGTVSAVDDFEDDDELVIDEHFPELTYDDTSDPEFEPPTPEASSRSFTRRSQQSKDKVLKLKEDVPTTDRKLRSSDSPKPQEIKKAQEKPQESAKSALESPKKQESETKDQEEKENGEKTEKVEVDVVIEIDGDDEPRKPDTNYSKSRVKVSPYRRSVRADHTASSVMANYTGNNTTMEMDITESSSFVSHDDQSLNDSSYLSGLRSIRGRRSYKPLKEMALRHVTANRSAKSAASTPASEPPARPTGTVVGRKRKPDSDDIDIDIEFASEASELVSAAHCKRVRLLDRLANSFRRTASSTPLRVRRAAEIVGINTDLPLTAPVASPDTFDPESLKTVPTLPPTSVSPDAGLTIPAPVSLTPPDADRDSKRCVVM